MKSRKIKTVGIATIVLLLVACAAPFAYAEGSRSAVITSLTGEVRYLTPGAGEWTQVTLGMVLNEKDTVKTASDSSCTILFKGMSDSVIEMRPNSVMELKFVSTADRKDDTELGLTLGSILVKAESLQGESEFQVRTPNSIVGIRGTQFEVNVTEL